MINGVKRFSKIKENLICAFTIRDISYIIKHDQAYYQATPGQLLVHWETHPVKKSG